MCLRLLLKAILITSLVVGSVRGQWCHWLRWECQRSAILCRPVRQRACCSDNCSGGSGSEDAVYNSQSLMLHPPFYCDMAANSSSTVCASHFAQYTPSANASLWCAWTYWTAWATVMESGSAGVCVWKRVRSRQRACECPPPLVTSTNSSNSSSQCDSGSLVGDSDNSTGYSTGFATSIGADGVLRLFSTELTDPADGFEAPSSVCSTDGGSTDDGSGGVSSTESSRVSPSWAWVAAVAAVPLALLLVAASVVAGVCLGRLHAKRVRAAAAAAAELSAVAASSTATDSSAASSTAM